MEDFQSKYNGPQVEEMLDRIASGEAGGGGGGITVETDPIFSASPAASITEEKKAEWDNKVDKVSGKQLSTEDFTSALKTKLEGLSNYDDTELSEALSTLRGDFDKLVSGDTTTAIKTFNEVIAFLDGVQDTQDLSSIIASIEQQIAGKMDKVTLATVATSGSYNDLSNKPTIPSAVTESTVSGWGFTKNTGTYSKPSGGIPKTDLASTVQTSLGKADTALQSHQDISGKQDKLVSGTNIKTINGESILGSGDIEISGGSSSDVRKEVIWWDASSGDTITGMRPNVIYWVLDNLNITIESFEEASPEVESYDLFTAILALGAGYIENSLTLPDYVLWANGTIPELDDGGHTTYELSISRISDGYGYIQYYAVLTPFKPVE